MKSHTTHRIYCLSALAALALAGCAPTTAHRDARTVSGNGASVSIDCADCDAAVSGTGNTVTVTSAAKVGKLTLSGSNNLIHADGTIGAAILSGNDNTLEFPKGFTTTVTDSGIGNHVITF